jgi:hypothetical protein
VILPRSLAVTCPAMHNEPMHNEPYVGYVSDRITEMNACFLGSSDSNTLHRGCMRGWGERGEPG